MLSRSIQLAIIAGFGGTLPTLSKLASTYVAAPLTPMPELGMYLGLLLFFIIGVILCLGFGISENREALLVGIAAPAIITNVISGVATQDFRLINQPPAPQYAPPSTPAPDPQKKGTRAYDIQLASFGFSGERIRRLAAEPQVAQADWRYPQQQKFIFSPEEGAPQGNLFIQLDSNDPDLGSARTYVNVEVRVRKGITEMTDLVPVVVGGTRNIPIVTGVSSIKVSYGEGSAFKTLSKDVVPNIRVMISDQWSQVIDFGFVVGGRKKYERKETIVEIADMNSEVIDSASWSSTPPKKGWCYQEDRKRPGAGQFLAACHWSQMRCQEARGRANWPQTPCVLVDLSGSTWKPNPRGLLDSWYQYSPQAFPPPFPQL